MKQITLKISEKKYHTFLEFIKTLDYVEVLEVEKKTLDELQNGFKQVKQIREGKFEKQPAEDFLNEL